MTQRFGDAPLTRRHLSKTVLNVYDDMQTPQETSQVGTYVCDCYTDCLENVTASETVLSSATSKLLSALIIF